MTASALYDNAQEPLQPNLRFVRSFYHWPWLSLPATSCAEPGESLNTGIVSTMGINDVTEGTLMFRTDQAGRYTPAPVLKTDVQIAVTGTIARATVRQEFTN